MHTVFYAVFFDFSDYYYDYVNWEVAQLDNDKSKLQRHRMFTSLLKHLDIYLKRLSSIALQDGKKKTYKCLLFCFTGWVGI